MVRYAVIAVWICICISFVSSGFATSSQIDSKIAELKAEIQQAQIRLHQVEQQKQKKHLKLARDLELEAHAHPLIPLNSPFLAKDYTRYPANPYPNYFQYLSEDELNEIEFHFWFQGDMDSLMNINGLLVNDGRIQVPISRSNSIQRYWIRRGRPNIQGDVYQFINY